MFCRTKLHTSPKRKKKTKMNRRRMTMSARCLRRRGNSRMWWLLLNRGNALSSHPLIRSKKWRRTKSWAMTTKSASSSPWSALSQTKTRTAPPSCTKRMIIAEISKAWMLIFLKSRPTKTKSKTKSNLDPISLTYQILDLPRKDLPLIQKDSNQWRSKMKIKRVPWTRSVTIKRRRYQTMTPCRKANP